MPHINLLEMLRFYYRTIPEILYFKSYNTAVNVQTDTLELYNNYKIEYDDSHNVNKNVWIFPIGRKLPRICFENGQSSL